jgi:cation:H+ antiporter
MILVLQIGAILVLSFVMGKATNKLIKILDVASGTFHIGHYEMTSIVVALATSLPEIMVSITASIQKSPNLALGNAIGSNLVNIALILGLSAVVGRSLHFHGGEKIKDLLGPLIYIFAPFLMALDGSISRPDGLLLVLIYIRYVVALVKKDRSIQSRLENEANKQIKVKTIGSMLMRFLFFAGVMVGASWMIVALAKSLAMGLDLPILFVGLFLVSIGTSLPEMVFNIESVRNRKVEMSFGNVVGSCVANATLIVGLSALIYPITISNMSTIVVPGVEQLFVVALLLIFVFSKRRLDWWEGLIMMGLFFYYSVIELMIK